MSTALGHFNLADHVPSLKDLQSRFKGKIPMAQHGTGTFSPLPFVPPTTLRSYPFSLVVNIDAKLVDENSDKLFLECLKNGMTKVSPSGYLSRCKVKLTEVIQVNINSWARDPYNETLSKGIVSKGFPDAVEDAVEAFAVQVERFIKLLGSAGKVSVTGASVPEK